MKMDKVTKSSRNKRNRRGSLLPVMKQTSSVSYYKTRGNTHPQSSDATASSSMEERGGIVLSSSTRKITNSVNNSSSQHLPKNVPVGPRNRGGDRSEISQTSKETQNLSSRQTVPQKRSLSKDRREDSQTDDLETNFTNPKTVTESDSMSVTENVSVSKETEKVDGNSYVTEDSKSGLFLIPSEEDFLSVVKLAQRTISNHRTILNYSKLRNKLQSRILKQRIKINANLQQPPNDTEETIQTLEQNVSELNEILNKVSHEYNTKQLLFNRIKMSQAGFRHFFPEKPFQSCLTPEEKSSITALVNIQVIYTTHSSAHMKAVEILQETKKMYIDKQEKVRDRIKELKSQLLESRAAERRPYDNMVSEYGEEGVNALEEWKSAVARVRRRLLLRCHILQKLIGGFGLDWINDSKLTEALLLTGKLISRHSK